MTNKYPHIKYKFTPISIEESKIRTKIFYKQMNKRRSIRFFSEKQIPFEIIENLVKTGGTAPSGAHMQPWTFVVVRDPKIKKQIRIEAEKEEKLSYQNRMTEEWLEALAPLGTDWRKPFLEKAPYLIAIFRQRYGFFNDGRKKKHYYTTESVGIATGILITAIHNAGLVTLTHTPSPMNFLKKILERPDNEIPFILLPVGYPSEDSTVPDLQRKELNEILVVK